MTTKIISRLQEAKINGTGIQQEIADDVLSYYPTDAEVKSFFHDLLNYGCVSGLISSLIYYTDTHAFFDRHYDEIEELRFEYEQGTGESLRIESDLKNTLAWFAFEETARRLAGELGIEV